MLSTPPAFILSQDQTLMLKCLFPCQNDSGFLFPKKQRFVPCNLSIAFLLFLRFSISAKFLEWKFIEFSGLFHCLIIKVPDEIWDFTATDFVWLLMCCSRSDLISLTHSQFFVKHFFTFSKKIFTNLQHWIVWIVLTFRSFEAALLSYHSVCGLSTPNLNYF